MKFLAQVSVLAPDQSTRLYRVHAEEAKRLVRQKQAKRLASGRIALIAQEVSLSEWRQHSTHSRASLKHTKREAIQSAQPCGCEYGCSACSGTGQVNRTIGHQIAFQPVHDSTQPLFMLATTDCGAGVRVVSQAECQRMGIRRQRVSGGTITTTVQRRSEYVL